MIRPELANFVPRKSSSGAHFIVSHSTDLPSGLRRLLLLADGQRTLFTLSQLMPDRDVEKDLRVLMQRGFIEDGRVPIQAPEGDRMDASASEPDLPEGWESASGFMASRARETLGVMAVDVIEALEQANDPEAARIAMSQWYKAMRGSREGRERVDQYRLEAAAMFKAAQRTAG